MYVATRKGRIRIHIFVFDMDILMRVKYKSTKFLERDNHFDFYKHSIDVTRKILYKNVRSVEIAIFTRFCRRNLSQRFIDYILNDVCVWSIGKSESFFSLKISVYQCKKFCLTKFSLKVSNFSGVWENYRLCTLDTIIWNSSLSDREKKKCKPCYIRLKSKRDPRTAHI